MPKGKAEIPELRLEVLQDFITQFKSPPNLIMSAMFSTRNAASSTIKWESQKGGRGMVPFVPPGAPAPRSAPYGIAQHSAEAAYWKEKRYFDEEFLNNLRKPGTDAQHWTAMDILADNMADLVNRSNRRKEWMFCRMLFENGFTYQVKGGQKIALDYGIPSDHRVTLGSSYYWDTGGSKDIMGDIKTAKRKIAEANGSVPKLAIINSNVLDIMGKDTTLRQLLQKNYFGDGSLMASSGIHNLALVNKNVLGALLDLDIMVYDEMYEVKAWLTANVTANSSTWVTVDDASDFDADQTLTIWDASDGSYESRYILAVDKFNNMLQIEYPFSSSYISGEDYVTMKRYFIPDDKFCLMATSVDNRPIARYIQAPFGIGRHYGLYTDKKEEWDPEGVYIRVQDKGLPVLYQVDAIYTIDITATAAQGATSTTTTTTTSSSSTTTTTA